jgi:hypothetical protein
MKFVSLVKVIATRKYPTNISETGGACAPMTTAIANNAATPRIATEVPPPGGSSR